eukprot:5135108-Pyramimonas_sp.AAC.1
MGRLSFSLFNNITVPHHSRLIPSTDVSQSIPFNSDRVFSLGDRPCHGCWALLNEYPIFLSHDATEDAPRVIAMACGERCVAKRRPPDSRSGCPR